MTSFSNDREMDAAYEENDRLVAEINRRRGSESALRSVFTEVGIANQWEGITLTAAQKVSRLNEIRLAWRKAARFLYDVINSESSVAELPVDFIDKKDRAQIAALITAAADLEDKAAIGAP
jgi:hypothetical protein